jgi:hypothetical protein
MSVEGIGIVGKKSFPSEDSIGKNVEGQIERGGDFWGTLEGYDETYLYLKGHNNREIIVKRRSIARLMVVD